MVVINYFLIDVKSEQFCAFLRADFAEELTLIRQRLLLTSSKKDRFFILVPALALVMALVRYFVTVLVDFLVQNDHLEQL